MIICGLGPCALNKTALCHSQPLRVDGDCIDLLLQDEALLEHLNSCWSLGVAELCLAVSQTAGAFLHLYWEGFPEPETCSVQLTEEERLWVREKREALQ